MGEVREDLSHVLHSEDGVIINIRGTSGSGKTHLARQLMQATGPDVVVADRKGKAQAHMCWNKGMVPIFFLGSYANICGGCDGIKTQNMVCSMVRHYSQFGHVVFEGLILSHIWSRYKALDDELSALGERYVWAYLNTPLDVCLDNVRKRREARGDMRELNPMNTTDKYHCTVKSMGIAQTAGCEVVVLDYFGKPLSQLLELMRSDIKYLRFSQNYREDKF